MANPCGFNGQIPVQVHNKSLLHGSESLERVILPFLAKDDFEDLVDTDYRDNQ